MTDSEVQTKLNELEMIANELAKEAKKRYGANGRLFFEADGAFHFMRHDGIGAISDRQSGIVMSSQRYTDMECGAW